MNILFAASEAVPFCKTGGLADVAGALPLELSRAGQSVVVVLPLYRAIRPELHHLTLTKISLRVSLGTWKEGVSVWEAPRQDNLRILFIDSPNYFDREGLYGFPPGQDFFDNDRRYALFSRAVLEVAKAIKFKPDVIHTHDWQTGLVSAYLKTVYSRDRFFKSTGSLFTIHNMAYQGHFPPESFGITGLPLWDFTPEGLEFYGKVNYMKGGVVYADAISTVSPTYAKEIISVYEFGWGLEGILKNREDRLVGILNGLDGDAWNPKTDPHLIQNYDVSSIAKRKFCKVDLQKTVGISSNPALPVLGFIGRLDRQKGVDLILQAAPALLSRGVQLVCLGVGDPFLQSSLLSLQMRYPTQVAVETRFSEPLAHKIYAGCDMFLMPSTYEPCGLGQLIAMRYGALPVVTPTGGLLDTVSPLNWIPKGTGFVSSHVSFASYRETLYQALDFYRREQTWRDAQKRAMKADFSWHRSVPEYLDIYEKAQQWRKDSY